MTAWRPSGASGRRLRRGSALLLEDHGAELGDGVRLERHAPRQKLEQDDAERPDVGARVDVARRRHLLGRHVERRAHHGRRLRSCRDRSPRRRCPVTFEMPKSSTLTTGEPSARRHEEQVRRLEVAVDDAERVRLGDRLAGLEHVLDGVARPAARRALARARRGRAPSRYSMTMYGAPVSSVADVDHARDVLALDAHRRARLAQEALDRLGVLRAPRGKRNLIATRSSS